MELLPHRDADWPRVRRSSYLLHQVFRYEYPARVRALRQRLVVVPRAVHGNQRRVSWEVRVSQPARRCEFLDRFGNQVVEFAIDHVEPVLEFEALAEVNRSATAAPATVMVTGDYLATSRLTAPDDRLRAAAAELAAGSGAPLDLAERACQWAHDNVRYEAGVTHVGTSAAEALTLGRGVCQDQTHAMLAVLRAAGVPARYVSGHLLGEGGSHAWVEVLAPGLDGRAVPVAFDPTHARRAGLSYVTVAVGRDYGDIAPVSGRYASPHLGVLTVRKRAGLTDVQYELAS